MDSFRFVHASDLHLDSPLIGLSQKSLEYAQKVEQASRTAFDNLITLTIEERCKMLVLGGDLFDGEWRDFRTGLFFASRMRRLDEAGIQVFAVLGNHDAENEFTSRLKLSSNVHLFSASVAESRKVEGIDAVVHGRSFPRRDVTENLADSYPVPHADCFNIGVLHTACSGRDGHASYAPCTVEQLVNHGYQYWALGHVHAREVLSREPYVVFPGNLQARHPREAGPKGATLVTVTAGAIARVEHRVLDVIRWAYELVDVNCANTRDEVVRVLRDRIASAYEAADGRGLALRLAVTGRTACHDELVTKGAAFREELETVLESIAGDIWLEKLELRTGSPERADAVDPTMVGPILSAIDGFADGEPYDAALKETLAKLRAQLPSSARLDELEERLRPDLRDRARRLARSVVELGQE